jgi:hypothetical protein
LIWNIIYSEAISKLGFSVEISRRRSAGQERETEDQPAGILKYVEDLRRGLNADIGRKDFFEMNSSDFPSTLFRRQVMPMKDIKA